MLIPIGTLSFLLSCKTSLSFLTESDMRELRVNLRALRTYYLSSDNENKAWEQIVLLRQ